MAISQEQADTADIFHDPRVRPCESRTGPIRWRRNGVTKRWKREPLRFRLPVKHGLSSYGQIENESNAAYFMHTGADCPVAPEGHN